ncbi:hypothetical protein [Paenibacillus senegalensis]|uniref:hypothetical protein n=1 Tax=Paenibacillus senegalensis TaxID=1465766 RepID=UPI000288EBB5|nr:hypothetical protein [Paenibacillus senegalensis]
MRLGRALNNHQKASAFAKEHPELIISLVEDAEKAIQWTSVQNFFSLFPPIKRYKDDGTWCFKSTKQMIQEDMGDKFGKDDLKLLLSSKCYENKFIHLVGFAFMVAASELYERHTGQDIMDGFLK